MMYKLIKNSALLFFFAMLLLLFALSCLSESNSPQERPGATKKAFFQLKDAFQTGITFSNNVVDQRDFNILTYRNYYNGGGVAIGDINNDGLSDIFFTSNLEKNQLYLNKGDFTFENISKQAQIGGKKSWSTGVTMADVNGDGWLDIYVCNSGDVKGNDKENELFINTTSTSTNNEISFKEAAATFGLNNKGYSTQAAFFDADMDGDLDVYLLNNSFKDPKKIELYRSMRDIPDELGGDKLYRNDNGKFVDVTTESGIYSSAIGFGLGACIGDVNQDYLPDIYVSNDFWERDYLYINQGNGQFSEELIDRINFCPISSMGGDIADMNNDGFPEIVSTDMLAGDNYRLKAVSAFDPFHLEDMKYRANYHYQIGQNCMQLNDGHGRFQEVSMMANVGATDWSWGALVFDFENDGKKDLFISNGIQRDLMNLDFRDFMKNSGEYAKIAENEAIDFRNLIKQMPTQPLSNYAFVNNGDLKYDNQTVELGLDQASFSNGSAYADLDNDGDLDLVVNNVNMPAFVYQNQSESLNNNYLKIKFEGSVKNPFGIGAQVKIFHGEDQQLLQNFNTRGFESSVEPNLIFGLGKNKVIEKLEVIWPDKKSQTLSNVAVNQTLVLKYNSANQVSLSREIKSTLFSEQASQLIKGNRKHVENRYNDFDHEPLLTSMLSKEGPRILKGDVNNDQREDFILLGAKNDSDKLFIQSKEGRFREKNVPHFTATKEFESGDGALFDFDGDGDLDLILSTAGNEYQDGGKYFILRQFINDGIGNFKVDNSKIPQVIGNFSTVKTADIDNDGDQDLFLGARLVPGNYGMPPKSYLLRNDNGIWSDISSEAISGVGMVTDANWADIDNDGFQDLIVVGDWMEVSIFKNNDGSLSLKESIVNSSGWWNRIEAADLDQDGDVDFVLGNRGTNSKFKAKINQPLSMFVNDFDGNGKSEPIINWFAPLENKAYPFASKKDLIGQIPQLRKSNLKYEDYANKTYEDLFDVEMRKTAFAYKAVTLESAILWNESGNFSLEALPKEAQVAPIFGIIADDLDGDQIPDIWLGGNLYALQPQVGRHDASRGVFLKGTGNGKFDVLSSSESGIFVEGEVRDAVVVISGKKKNILIARNNDEVLLFRKSN